MTAFLKQVAQASRLGEVHVIWDNLNAREEAKLDAFNRTQRARF